MQRTQIAEGIYLIPEVESTNAYLRDWLQTEPTLAGLTAVMATHQSKGRGQRGNGWHTQAGQNLTYSFLLRTGTISATEQFVISQMVAWGLYKTILRYLPPTLSQHLSIKWPNDMYYQDRKLAGILIEHSITGSVIDYSIVGIGLNLNQTSFPTELPNPISLSQITGMSYEPAEVMTRLMKRYGYLRTDIQLWGNAQLHRLYMSALYRREGLHAYEDKGGQFLAEIVGVDPHGLLRLQLESGELRSYGFKEIKFV